MNLHDEGLLVVVVAVMSFQVQGPNYCHLAPHMHYHNDQLHPSFYQHYYSLLLMNQGRNVKSSPNLDQHQLLVVVMVVVSFDVQRSPKLKLFHLCYENYIDLPNPPTEACKRDRCCCC